jgi:hypothetical protein
MSMLQGKQVFIKYRNLGIDFWRANNYKSNNIDNTSIGFHMSQSEAKEKLGLFYK